MYNDDPEKNWTQSGTEASYQTVLRDDLRVMDAAGISLARDNSLPIFVFNMLEPGNIVRAVSGGDIGTLITGRIVGKLSRFWKQQLADGGIYGGRYKRN